MRCRPIATAGEALEHVAEVADEAVRDGFGGDPSVRRTYFESAALVLSKEREKSVVGVLRDTPVIGCPRRWIAEDTEQDQGIGRQVVGKPHAVETKSKREATKHHLTERRHDVHVAEDRVAQFRGLVEKQVPPMQRCSGSDAGVLIVELGPEVQAFLLVRHTGRQLAAQRKPTPPGAAGERHGDHGFVFLGAGEEHAGRAVEAREQGRIDAVADDGEEADFAASAIEPHRDVGYILLVRVTYDQRANVYDRHP